MKKTYIVLSVVVVICVSVWYIVYKTNFITLYVLNAGLQNESVQLNLHDGTYILSGQKIFLKNGLAKSEVVPGSSSKMITTYFGNDTKGDFDNDGREDLAFIITQQTGGSGTFYYAVALLNRANGKVGTEAVLIGDRISPQATGVENRGGGDILIVNYADRKPQESFVVPPSVAKSLYLKLDPKSLQFGEVVKDFEGESNI